MPQSLIQICFNLAQGCVFLKESCMMNHKPRSRVILEVMLGQVELIIPRIEKPVLEIETPKIKLQINITEF